MPFSFTQADKHIYMVGVIGDACMDVWGLDYDDKTLLVYLHVWYARTRIRTRTGTRTYYYIYVSRSRNGQLR